MSPTTAACRVSWCTAPAAAAATATAACPPPRLLLLEGVPTNPPAWLLPVSHTARRHTGGKWRRRPPGQRLCGRATGGQSGKAGKRVQQRQRRAAGDGGRALPGSRITPHRMHKSSWPSATANLELLRQLAGSRQHPRLVSRAHAAQQGDVGRKGWRPRHPCCQPPDLALQFVRQGACGARASRAGKSKPVAAQEHRRWREQAAEPDRRAAVPLRCPVRLFAARRIGSPRGITHSE